MPTTKEVLSFSIDNGYMAPLDMKPPFALHKPWGVNPAKGHGLFYNRIKETIDQVNKRLSVIEKVRKFIIIDHEFTIENEMMTPTLKVRRFVVKEKYGNELEKLY